MEFIYKLENVSKTYRQGRRVVEALKGVDLEIPEGSLVMIQGPTGGGKSTLLQLLGGLDIPSNGAVSINGVHTETMGEKQLSQLRAEQVGFVFQHFNLIPTLSAAENIRAALVPLKISAKVADEKVAAALEAVGLSDRANHLPTELSGGQQQRVAIARALVKSPKVLLADEPTGNLDEQTRDEIIGLLEILWREQGLTLIVVTHDSAVAGRGQIRLNIADGEVSAA